MKNKETKPVLSVEEEAKLYVTRSEMLRYRNNRLPYYFSMLSICVLVAAFCTVYGYITQVSALTGADILINIATLLITFMAAEGVKVYKRKWGFISFGIGAWHIIHIYYPIILHTTALTGGASGSGVVLEPVRTSVVIILDLLAAALMIASGVITLIRNKRLEKFLKGEITVDKVLEGNK